MGRLRIIRESTAVYHCITRTVGGAHLLDDKSKDVLRSMVWKVAGFCGVEILAYCLMSNHFHILVRVPKAAPEEPVSKEEVLRRYRFLYENSNTPNYPDADVLQTILEGNDEELAEEWRLRLAARMSDVSEFMRTLKHRFTFWFNKENKRFGTIWAERFLSVLVQNSPDSRRTVAAYIDLNPVRAHLVEEPSTYRWCSYAEAMAGNEAAQEGLAKTVGEATWETARRHYRVILFGKGGASRQTGKGTIASETVREVMIAEGEAAPCNVLRGRLTCFSKGAILGSDDFVIESAMELLSRERGHIPPLERKYRKHLTEVPIQLSGENEGHVVSWN